MAPRKQAVDTQIKYELNLFLDIKFELKIQNFSSQLNIDFRFQLDYDLNCEFNFKFKFWIYKIKI